MHFQLLYFVLLTIQHFFLQSNSFVNPFQSTKTIHLNKNRNTDVILSSSREGRDGRDSNRGGGSRENREGSSPRANSRESFNAEKISGIRQARISRSIRDELAEMICEGDIRAISYPDEDLLKSTCITDVEISSDLTYAKVYISVIGNSVERRQVFVWLCENVGQVRYELAKRLRHMKRIPEIFFKLSDNKESSDLINLIDQVSTSSSISNEGNSNMNDEVDDDEEEEDDDYEIVEEEESE